MSATQLPARACLCLCLAIIPRAVPGQERVPAGGGPLAAQSTLHAPFAADATTTVHQVLPDGTRVERRATARYYRDGEGRVRVEQIVSGSGELRITVSGLLEPGSRMVTLYPATRTMSEGMRFAADQAVGGGDTFALPLGGIRFLVFWRVQSGRDDIGGAAIDSAETEPLGSRRIAGVEVTGSRTTMTASDTRFAHGRRFEIVDERWESPELNILIESRYADPRMGVIEYRLTNIRRIEPPSHLFDIPADYAPRTLDPWISLSPANPWDAVTVAAAGFRR